MVSIGDLLDRNRGYGPGFDFLRVFLALSIVLLHSFTCTNQFFPWGDQSPTWFIHYALVPMFFALSGFLVTSSANRLTLGTFLTHRILRIVPALAVDTIVCACVIGPLMTKIALAEYFSSTDFFKYFFNIIGYVHYDLPGVFRNLPVTRVNGSLWTVPFEILCYVIISLMIVTRAITTRFVILSLIVAYVIVSCFIDYFKADDYFTSFFVRKAIDVAFIEYEAQAVTAFLCGIVLFQNRERIPYSPVLFTFCVFSSILIACTVSIQTGTKPVMRLILMPLICYSTVFLGLTGLKTPPFFRTGDYSYGIYLYHQPFLQVTILMFPSLSLTSRWGAPFVFILAIPSIMAVAYLSWHCIEKPTLKLRKVLITKSASRAEKIKGIRFSNHDYSEKPLLERSSAQGEGNRL